MKFGPVAIGEAEGAFLAHSTLAGELRLRKGHRLTAGDIAALREAGVASVIAAKLDADDLGEDEAATRIARALKFRAVEAKPSATGRVNLHAKLAGIFTVERRIIDAINAIDPAITIATLAEHAPVAAGQMVATVKIIPFAAPAAMVDKAVAIAAERALRAAHEEEAVAKAIRELAQESDMVILFGASAMSDPGDVIPAAIRAAGGTVIRAGMPVDPGNLLVLGELDGKPVLGAPGCARSPKENGFDWVLDRIAAGVPVGGDDIAGMGVGGLLMEIPTRPQPRETVPRPAAEPKLAAVLLAAGRSSRMGGPNKLFAEFDGEALVHRTASRLMNGAGRKVIVVTGHQGARIRDALAGLNVEIVDNPDFANGLASSLKAGIAQVPADADGALIALADMPGVTAGDFDRLAAAFRRHGGRAIVRATHAGKRGNPVILPRALFPEVAKLEGDTGARAIVESGAAEVVDVELGAAASLDVDTPEAMLSAGGVLRG
jgi:molybdenum cofactor cytidylyltransferase